MIDTPPEDPAHREVWFDWEDGATLLGLIVGIGVTVVLVLAAAFALGAAAGLVVEGFQFTSGG